MVIGSSTALRELAEKIQAGVSGAEDIKQEAWPHQVASFPVTCGVSEKDPFTVSFHIETISGAPATNVSRNTKPFYLLLLLSAFAAIGAITVLRWLAANVF